MPSPPTILGFIVPKLAVQTEDAMTDCLWYMLATYEAAADSLVAHLRQAGVTLPAPLQFRTCVVWEQGGIVDMGGFCDDRTVLLIENKFWAPLTKHQPTSYLRQLPAGEGGVVVFLAPRARVDDLWTELAGRCAEEAIAVGQRVDHGDGVVSAPVLSDRCHRLVVCSWESLLARFARDFHAAGNAQAIMECHQLEGLSARLIAGELDILDFTSTPAPGDHRDAQLIRMVDDIAAGLADQDWAIGAKAIHGQGCYGRYMTLAGHEDWGVEHCDVWWRRFGDSLIWLVKWFATDDAPEMAALDLAFPGQSRRMDGNYLLPLKVENCQSGAEALFRLTEQVIAAARVLEPIEH
jgi:hypothetical protein